MTASIAERVISATRARGHEAAVLLLSALAVGLWVLRGRWGAPAPYLLGNLWLAWIPWLLGCVVARARARAVAALTFLPWLLFAPNAPYLVTDLLHLRPRPPVPVWFDALLYGAFAVAGCALGWTSISMVRERAGRALGVVRAEAALVGIAFLIGFGVYLGRFGRWNSSDAWERPAALLAGMAASLSSRCVAFSALFGLFVWAGVLMVGPGRVPERPAG